MNKTYGFITVAALAFTGLAATTLAAPEQEGFESFAGTQDGVSGSTGFDGLDSDTTIGWVGAGAVPSGGNFGGTAIIVDTSAPFEGTNSLTWAGDSDAWANMAGNESYGEIITGTAGSFYTAFAVRVNSLDVNDENNDIEIFRLGQGAGLSGLHIGVRDGVLELVGRNGANLSTLDSEAFTDNGTGDWDDGTWRVLGVSATYDTVGANSVVNVFEVPPSGPGTLLGSQTTFTAANASGITHYSYGAFAAPPTGTSGISISVDDINIWPGSDFASDAEFISAVQQVLHGTSFVMSAPYNGNGPGTSVINASGTGDYTSLEAAFNAIETAPLTGGDWTFLIETDLMESTQLLVGQNTNGNSIIIKPAPGTQPTVFLESNLSTTVGPSGHIIIGATTYNIDSSIVKTDNFIIDGSNNGTDSQDLTFVTVPNGNESGVISIIGDSDNVQIKNCILTLDSPRTIFQQNIRVQSINNGSFSNLTPDNTLIENCILNANTGSGTGIVLNQGGGDVFGLAPNNTVIRNNIITSARYGIRVQDHRSIDMLDNQITITGVDSDGVLIGISSFRNTASTDSYEINIERNEIFITQELPSDSVAEGISFSGTREPGSTNAIYNIRNNSVFIEPANSTPDAISRIAGIRIALQDADVKIQNNSVNVYVPDSLTVSNVPQTSAFVLDNDTSGNDYVVENNIFRFDGMDGYAVTNNLDAGTIYSNDNNYFLSRGTAYGSVMGSDAPNLFDYKQATGLDSSSTDTDPFEIIAGITGTWTSKSDLRFNGPPFMNFMGVPVAGITTDLDGIIRDASTPTKGAFEISSYAEITSIAGDLFLYY